ncbi:50S ribosomal protein L19 [bacterium HR34]|nr:50S ribosomal protein L19 [bacterium HR34]
MTHLLVQKINKKQEKTNIPPIRTGNKVKVYQKIKEGDKEKVQMFEGIVIAKKHGKGLQATITVRKVIGGIGVERIFPIHSPTIEKIEIVSPNIAKRSKIYYIREISPKRVKEKLRRKKNIILEEAAVQEITEELKEEQPTKEKSTENQQKESQQIQQQTTTNQNGQQEQNQKGDSKTENNSTQENK